MDQQDRDYLAQLDEELATGEFDELERLWTPGEEDLAAMSTEELEQYYRDFMSRHRSPTDHGKLSQSLKSMRDFTDLLMDAVDEAIETGDRSKIQVQHLGPEDGYQEGAKKFTLQDGSSFTMGDLTEEGHRENMIRSILNKQGVV